VKLIGDSEVYGVISIDDKMETIEFKAMNF
jgi:hypothetical protein